jgi:hypothetical protein
MTMLEFRTCFSSARDHCHLLSSPKATITMITTAVKESQRRVRNKLSMATLYAAKEPDFWG